MGSSLDQILVEKLVEKLAKLDDTKESIDTLSNWCMLDMNNKAKHVVDTWNRQFYIAPRKQGSAYLYLANDILQKSWKPSEFVKEFLEVLPEAFRHMIANGDERGKIAACRLVKIWEERKVLGSDRHGNRTLVELKQLVAPQIEALIKTGIATMADRLTASASSIQILSDAFSSLASLASENNQPAGTETPFPRQILVEKLVKLENTKESLETLLKWCILHKNEAKHVVETWNMEFLGAPHKKYLYLASLILHSSSKREFVEEFSNVLPKAFRHMIANGDKSGKKAACKMVTRWETVKVFECLGDGKRTIEELKRVVSLVEVDVVFGKYENAAAYLVEFERDLSSGHTRELKPEEVKVVHRLRDVVRGCIKQLEGWRTSRTTDVSQLREDLKEKERQLEKVCKYLKAARLKSKLRGKICRQRPAAEEEVSKETIQVSSAAAGSAGTETPSLRPEDLSELLKAQILLKKFAEELAEKVAKLNGSKKNIKTLSDWCIKKKAKHVVETWDKQFHRAPREQRLVYLYLAEDILEKTSGKGLGFVEEFSIVLADAFDDMIANGDEREKKSACNMVTRWEKKKVFESFGDGKRTIKELKRAVSLVDEDVVFGKYKKAVRYLEKVERDLSSGHTRELKPEEVEMVHFQDAVLRECIEQLGAMQTSRNIVVDQLREALNEEERQLNQVRHYLQVARLQSEQTDVLCGKLRSILPSDHKRPKQS